MGLPNTYRVQDSCVKCTWSYIWCQQDEPMKCHCKKHAPSRPWDGACGTTEDFTKVMSREHPSVDPRSEEYTNLFVAMMDAWTEWSNEFEVDKCGMCSEFARPNIPISARDSR